MKRFTELSAIGQALYLGSFIVFAGLVVALINHGRDAVEWVKTEYAQQMLLHEKTLAQMSCDDWWGLSSDQQDDLLQKHAESANPGSIPKNISTEAIKVYCAVAESYVPGIEASGPLGAVIPMGRAAYIQQHREDERERREFYNSLP